MSSSAYLCCTERAVKGVVDVILLKFLPILPVHLLEARGGPGVAKSEGERVSVNLSGATELDGGVRRLGSWSNGVGELESGGLWASVTGLGSWSQEVGELE